jgi:hypothetical protein
MNEENKIEKLFKKYNDEMKRHTSALGEEFQSRLSAVAEGVVGLGEKVDILNENVGLLNEKVDDLTVRMDMVENTLSDVVHTQKIHTEMIGELMENNSEVKIDIENKVDKKEFIELKQTVLAIS